MGPTFLMAAIDRRDLAAVHAALDAGARVEGSPWSWLITRRLQTPLLAAVRTGSIEMVRLLLDRGADPNRDTAVWRTPLALATYEGNRPMVELLLDRGAAANPERKRHESAIEMAAWYGHPELVALLLERGADPDLVLSKGDSSLVRVRAPILAMLIASGGHASPSIARMVEAEIASLDGSGEVPRK
jgi:ankyrin repeat protein